MGLQSFAIHDTAIIVSRFGNDLQIKRKSDDWYFLFHDLIMHFSLNQMVLIKALIKT